MSIIQSLKVRRDFLEARYQGEKALARGLVIQAISRDTNAWRVGLTASKKIGNAVCRNKARRRMRALARQHLVSLARPGTDYVLIARRDILSCEWPDLVSGLRSAIRYLHRKLPEQQMAPLS